MSKCVRNRYIWIFELIESSVNHVDKINQAADAEGCINN